MCPDRRNDRDPGSNGSNVKQCVQIDAMIETLVAVLTILQEKPLLHDYIRYTPYVCKDEDYSAQCGGYMKGFLEKGGEPGKLALTVRPDGQLTGHRNGN